MLRASRMALLFVAIVLVIASISAAQETKPVLTAKDRGLIEAYYTRLMGTLAPGSLDRTTFPFGIEKTLVVGSRVPMQLERTLEPLPTSLELRLSQITGDYGRFTLGRHVVLIKKADLTIADILKNVAVKETAK